MQEIYALYVIAGLALCLLGWTLYWVGLRLLGGAFGAIAFTSLSWFLLEHFHADPQWALVLTILAGAFGALGGYFLIVHAHYFVFFITGAMLGLAIAMTVETSYPVWFDTHVDTPLMQLIFYSGFALVMGVLVLLLNHVIVCAVTAFAGAVLVVTGLPPDFGVWLFLPLMIGSFLLQMGILAALGRPRRPEPETDERTV